MKLEIPKWQVHRGYWKGGLRENTLQSFIAAKRLGAKMVELDVQLSRDKVSVVFHDWHLKKFFHVDALVEKTSWDDLRALNVASLEQVLRSEDVPEYLNIEIKSLDFYPFRAVKNVEQLIMNLLQSLLQRFQHPYRFRHAVNRF